MLPPMSKSYGRGLRRSASVRSRSIVPTGCFAMATRASAASSGARRAGSPRLAAPARSFQNRKSSTASGRRRSSPIPPWPKPSACSGRRSATIPRRRPTCRQSTGAAIGSWRLSRCCRHDLRRTDRSRRRLHRVERVSPSIGGQLVPWFVAVLCGMLAVTALWQYTQFPLRFRRWFGCASTRRRVLFSIAGRPRWRSRRRARFSRGLRATRRAGCTSGGRRARGARVSRYRRRKCAVLFS